MESLRAIGCMAWAIIVALALLAGITLIGWRVGWWFTAQNANRNYQVTQNGVSNQDTLRHNISQYFGLLASQEAMAGYYAKSNPSLGEEQMAEATATAQSICGDAQQVVTTAVPLPVQEQHWISANCADGALSSHSRYLIPGR